MRKLIHVLFIGLLGMTLRTAEKNLSVEQGEAMKLPKFKSQKVLDEDTYLELEAIVKRDFFPDTEHLRNHCAYLLAEEEGELERMREIALRQSRLPQPTVGREDTTPASFDSPHPSSSFSQSTLPPATADAGSADASSLPTLDAFLAQNTSEDNSSFSAMMEREDKKSKDKHPWLFSPDQAAIEGPTSEGPKRLDTWKYTPKNSLMYYPEGIVSSDGFKKPRQVTSHNTRFARQPFSQAVSRTQLQQAAAQHAQAQQGKIGPDGREMLTQASPAYSLIATPSPAPGVSESPLMTWGEMEGTPFALDSPHQDRTPGPAFKIPAQGRREVLGLKMATEAAAKQRARKQAALQQVSRALTSPSSGVFGGSLTPAMQRLVARASAHGTPTDRALRAAYTPGRTSSGREQASPATPVSSNRPSLTDGLLAFPMVGPLASQPINSTESNLQDGTRIEALKRTDSQLQRSRKRASDFF
uniref:splicing factor ESS-2 homolog isoform X2 n=1 Tax=Myxine glutinosa TaxID=7769 RepID=UPI00358E17FB